MCNEKTTIERNDKINSFLVSHAIKDNENRWSCNKCGQKFIRSSSTLFHLEKVHDIQFEELERFSCDICNLKFTNRDSLKQHFYKKHKENDVNVYDIALQYTCDKNKNYICNICDAKFMKRTTLLNHLKGKHGVVIKYVFVCGVCEHHFMSRAGLIAHVKNKHVNDDFSLSKTCNYGQLRNEIARNFIQLREKADNLDDWQSIPVTIKVICCPKGTSLQTHSTCNDDLNINNNVLQEDKEESADNFEEMSKSEDLQEPLALDRSTIDCAEQKLTEKDENTELILNENYLSGDEFFELSIRKNSIIDSNMTTDKNVAVLERTEEFFNDNENSKVRQCTACGSIVSNANSLLLHIKTVHLEEYKRVTEEFDYIDLSSLDESQSNAGETNIPSPNSSILMDENFNSYSLNCDSNNSDVFQNDDLNSHISHSADDAVVRLKHDIMSKTESGINSNYNNSLFNIEVFTKRCHICKIIFPNRDVLLIHMETKHSSVSKYKRLTFVKNIKCPICHECFVNNKSLRDHQRILHTWRATVSLTCSICGSVLTSKINLKSHMATQHKDVNVNYEIIFVDCESKEYSFQEVEQSLLDDDKSIEDENIAVDLKKRFLRFKCKICKKKLKSKQSMIFHLKAVHGKTDSKLFCCPFCDYKSKINKYLEIHLTSKHPESEFSSQVDKYICDECGFGTINKRMFASHKYKHKTVYKCD